MASVLRQTYRPIEIILVDDGSTDDTPALIESLRLRSPEVIRSIRIQNSGPGGAREAGRQLARGEFIQYLDSDDVLESCKFEVQVNALRDHPECGVAYGITRLIDEGGCELENPYKWSGQKHDYLFPALLVERWWNTHTPLYRRSVCDAVGAWTTERMGEDWQYDARVGGLRTPLAFCQQLVSSHRDHAKGRLTRGKMTAQTARDSARLLPVLYKQALLAGVEHDASEMRHFARWAFLSARICAKFGLAEEHTTLVKTAIQASQGQMKDVLKYQKWVSYLGLRTVGYLCEIVDKFVNILKK